MTEATKRETYLSLVDKRRSCRLCANLTNPASVDGGRFDSDHIGPWSRWQANLDAELMIVGKDWETRKYFVESEGWDGPEHQTNGRLKELLASIGIVVPPAGDSPQPQVVFLTNAVLCLKEGESTAYVPQSYFHNCSREFLRSQIQIIGPKVVVGFGVPAFNSILNAFDITAPANFDVAVSDTVGTPLPNGSRAFAVYHCSNRRHGMTVQKRHWQRIRDALR